MGINALTHRNDGSKVATPVTHDDWRQWVSAGRTRNWILNDPLVDWLQLYGKSLDYVPRQELAGYDKELDFVEFIFEKGREFEAAILTSGGSRNARPLSEVMVGFTGTPIEKDFKRSTIGRFGPLIDAYTIPQSVAGGATVPIWYEARLPELAVEGPETLDRLCEAMFGDEPPAVQAQIRRRYANKETVAEAERRIEMIALDIAEHFKGKVRPNGFKAQVVAPSRAAALRYAERPEQLRPARLPRHHGCPQRRPGVQGGPRTRPGAGRQRLHRSGGGAGGAGRGRHAARGLRRPSGAGVVPGPGAAGARAAPGHRQGEPALLP